MQSAALADPEQARAGAAEVPSGPAAPAAKFTGAARTFVGTPRRRSALLALASAALGIGLIAGSVALRNKLAGSPTPARERSAPVVPAARPAAATPAPVEAPPIAAPPASAPAAEAADGAAQESPPVELAPAQKSAGRKSKARRTASAPATVQPATAPTSQSPSGPDRGF
jgi:hypothetical protein